MSKSLGARVKETTQTTGTGTLSLGGAPTGYQTFMLAFGHNVRCYYAITDGLAWEYGIGTVSSGSPDTLSRDTVLGSSTGGSKISLAAGTKNVISIIPPEACLNNGSTTFGDGTSNPSVKGGRNFLANNSAGTTITSFEDALDGQEICILFQNGNTTIQNNSSIKLAGGTNFTGTANDMLTLVLASSVWYEKARSIN